MAPSIADRTVKPGGFVGSTRKPADIRGFMVHMAEGINVAAYLGRRPRRNVSVQYTVEIDGDIVAMVPELRVAGSMNPDALRKGNDKGGYYGRSHLDFALKGGVTNPNKYVISIEVAGRHKDGPNEKQIASLVALFKDCRKRYPKIIPLGHRDQQDVKPCPGKTAGMRKAFHLMGGHGRDYDATPPVPKPEPKPPTPIEELMEQVADLEASNAAKEAVIRKVIEDLTDVLEAETEDETP
jgi:hypothetical protein